MVDVGQTSTETTLRSSAGKRKEEVSSPRCAPRLGGARASHVLILAAKRADEPATRPRVSGQVPAESEAEEGRPGAGEHDEGRWRPPRRKPRTATPRVPIRGRCRRCSVSIDVSGGGGSLDGGHSRCGRRRGGERRERGRRRKHQRAQAPRGAPARLRDRTHLDHRRRRQGPRDGEGRSRSYRPRCRGTCAGPRAARCERSPPAPGAQRSGRRPTRRRRGRGQRWQGIGARCVAETIQSSSRCAAFRSRGPRRPSSSSIQGPATAPLQHHLRVRFRARVGAT